MDFDRLLAIRSRYNVDGSHDDVTWTCFECGGSEGHHPTCAIAPLPGPDADAALLPSCECPCACVTLLTIMDYQGRCPDCRTYEHRNLFATFL